MIDYKQDCNFRKRFFMDEDDEYDENDDNEDLIFDYEIYAFLETGGEKMRYITNYNNILYDDFNEIAPTILNDIKNGLNDDIKNSLSAMKVLLKNGFPLQFDESISIEIINTLDNEEIFKDIQYIIMNYIIHNIDKVSSEIMILLNSKIFDMQICTNSKILKLASKLVRFYNYQYPLELFDEIFGKYEMMSFDEKKSLFELCFSMILSNKDAIRILIKYSNFVVDFTYEVVETKPLIGLFIISSLDCYIHFNNDFINEILEKIKSN